MSEVKARVDYGKQIREEDVKAALKADKGSKAELVSWSVEDFTKKGDNYATVVTSVAVTYCLDGKVNKISYVVKINPHRGSEATIAFFNTLYVKEAGFYEHILPMLNEALVTVGLKPLQLPKWYKNISEKDRELIFLEDLRPRGYKMFDRRKGMDLPHATLVLEELARLHASSVILNVKRPLEDIAVEHEFLNYDWSTHHKDQTDIMFSATMENAAEILGKFGGYESAQKWLIDHKGSSCELFEKSLVREDPFVMINHGDCWTNNVLFRYDDEGQPIEVMLVDLQVSRIASPATDLNYFICGSVDGTTRLEKDTLFLESYRHCFDAVMTAAGMTMPFDSKQLLKEYRKLHTYGLMLGTMLVSVLVMPSEDTPDMDKEIKEEDIQQHMAEYKEKMVSSALKNPLFKPRFLALYDYMILNGVI